MGCRAQHCTQAACTSEQGISVMLAALHTQRLVPATHPLHEFQCAFTVSGHAGMKRALFLHLPSSSRSHGWCTCCGTLISSPIPLPHLPSYLGYLGDFTLSREEYSSVSRRCGRALVPPSLPHPTALPLVMHDCYMRHGTAPCLAGIAASLTAKQRWPRSCGTGWQQRRCCLLIWCQWQLNWGSKESIGVNGVYRIHWLVPHRHCRTNETFRSCCCCWI